MSVGPSSTRDADDAPSAGVDALVLDEVRVSYEGVNALDHVTARVARGASMALIGPNGAGKSTLIKAVLGIVPLDHGRIRVLGRSPQEARRDVAYVPQTG